MSLIPLLNWSHKSNKLVWDDPVKISIFDLFVVFVFFDIEGLEVIPAKSLSILKSLENVKKGAIVEAVTS
jgi:hypothetical protein